jgi:hypothetical protein
VRSHGVNKINEPGGDLVGSDCGFAWQEQETLRQVKQRTGYVKLRGVRVMFILTWLS